MQHARLDRKGFLKRLGALTALVAARPVASAAGRVAPAPAAAPVARKAPQAVSRRPAGA